MKRLDFLCLENMRLLGRKINLENMALVLKFKQLKAMYLVGSMKKYPTRIGDVGKCYYFYSKLIPLNFVNESSMKIERYGNTGRRLPAINENLARLPIVAFAAAPLLHVSICLCFPRKLTHFSHILIQLKR